MLRASGWLGVAVALALGACSVGDQVCTPDSDLQVKDSDSCPYGPPGGPEVSKDQCPAITMNPAGPGCATATWESVFAIFDDPSKGQCTLGGCHGKAPGGRNIVMPKGDPQASFTALKNYNGDYPATYLADKADPGHSWILCNVAAAPGGGSPMPKPNGLVNPADLAVVQAWAQCGMPGPGAVIGAGGGGAGGAGGGP